MWVMKKSVWSGSMTCEQDNGALFVAWSSVLTALLDLSDAGEPMPNMDALSELVEVSAKLRSTKQDDLVALADRVECAVRNLGAGRAGIGGVREYLAERGSVLDRKNKALTLFRKWNKITGVLPLGVGYIAELEAIIEDAVDIGYYGCALASDWTESDTEPGVHPECDDGERREV